MQKIYVFKNLLGYQTYPVPEGNERDRYYAVDVENDVDLEKIKFTLTADGKVNIVERSDYRGTTVYHIQTRKKAIVDYLGEIAEGYTPLAPLTEFDEWDGEKWVTNTALKHQHDILQAIDKKAVLLKEANEYIAVLQDAVDLDMATDAEKALQLEWKKYRILLSRINTDTAPEINWPVIPA